jgi:hypothetical protein
MSEDPSGQQPENRGLLVSLGPVTVDVPRSLGYFGAVGLATVTGLIEPPLGVFIAAIPVVKMLMTRNLPRPVRFVGQVFDGAAQPVGGDAEGTVRLHESAADHHG